MNFEDVKTIVANGESDRVEFKSSTGQRTAAVKTVCAMLNGLGGFVIFGVGDKGKITGQQVAAKTLEDISNELRKIDASRFSRCRNNQFENRPCHNCPFGFRGRRPLHIRRPAVSSLGPDHYGHAPRGVQSASI